MADLFEDYEIEFKSTIEELDGKLSEINSTNDSNNSINNY